MAKITTKRFPPFSRYVCIGDSVSIEVDGFEVVARIENDEDSRIDDDDHHCADQNVTGCDDEQFARLLKARRAWNNDEWCYCGIALSVRRSGVTLDDHAASRYRVEMNYPGRNNGYLSVCADEMLDEAIERGRAILETLSN